PLSAPKRYLLGEPMRLSFFALLAAPLVITQAALSDPGRGAADAVSAARAGAIPLYNGTPPAGPGNPNAEQWSGDSAPALSVRNVSIPTLRPVLPPPARRTGTSVIVAPGGGLLVLAIGSEGMEVAKALAARGIAAFVLKYRTVPTAPDAAEFAK